MNEEIARKTPRNRSLMLTLDNIRDTAQRLADETNKSNTIVNKLSKVNPDKLKQQAKEPSDIIDLFEMVNDSLKASISELSDNLSIIDEIVG